MTYDSRYLMAAMTRRLSVSDGASPSLAKILAMCFSTTPAVMTSVSTHPHLGGILQPRAVTIQPLAADSGQYQQSRADGDR
jgi:hypothetical protein